jgi:phosphoglycolate phosphatase/putative hydrolase of the HAD superfamily
VELLGADIAGCISIGDRYDIDLALPLKLGMGGILVDGVSDVYRLPAVFEDAGFCP